MPHVTAAKAMKTIMVMNRLIDNIGFLHCISLQNASLCLDKFLIKIKCNYHRTPVRKQIRN